ncbi:MAG TPA: decarboxylating 6-phosphogluconate dehydrogenase [Bryobacteraceae bacterium]|nr:decarboxylating 6-phosphogluconate dehydrogenase [Bryobacteraceae bacterium]
MRQIRGFRLGKRVQLGRCGYHNMQIGMIGLGRMGKNMVRRLLRGDTECVVFDRSQQTINELVEDGAIGAFDMKSFIDKLQRPRTIWLMIPAAVVDQTLSELVDHLDADDVIVDGGNSHYVDDLRRAGQLASKGIHYVDVGTSGGVWGLDRGYCLMIGGDAEAVKRLDPIFGQLAPGVGEIARTPGRENLEGNVESGYLHCGPNGAGHFVKMVHNGIEYGLMAAYAEGLGILRNANIGTRPMSVDAETTPLSHPEQYQFELNVADIVEVWRRGSVVTSWLLDLTAAALVEDPELSKFSGQVSDSGEGRWTIKAAIDEGVPVPVLSTAVYQRFSSRGNSGYQDKLLSAMRYYFGGHREKPAGKTAA